MKILICPTGFKGSLQPDEAADCMEAGVLAALPDASIRKIPLVDGGEGFTRAIIKATGGTIHPATVTGPTGEPIESFFGFLGPNTRIRLSQKKTAVIEMCAAAGLSLVPLDKRDPTKTTTFGVGELILAAIAAGAERVIVGCGDSGTSDGGAGMIQALGGALLDSRGRPLPLQDGGGSLLDLHRFDLSGVDERIRDKAVPIEVAVNRENILCGPMGQARVFSKQKGATPEQTEHLALAMDNYADVAARFLRETTEDVGQFPGGGSAGGLGTGLRVLGAQLRPRYEVLAEYIDLESLFDGVDLVLTGEGGIDFQTPRGKIPGEVARRAKQHGLPVIAVVGTIGEGAERNRDAGVDAYVSILQGPMTLGEAVTDAKRLTKESVESVMRIMAVGKMLAETDRAFEAEAAEPEQSCFCRQM